MNGKLTLIRATGETWAGVMSDELDAQPASAVQSTTIPGFRIF
jgi:hypothetical protein